MRMPTKCCSNVSIGLALAVALAATPPGEARGGEETATCTAPAYRQFDFWIGRWEVRDADGTLLGHNQIQPILSGCALQEDWTGASGSSGRSLNMYDATRDRWHQTWVDAQGQFLELEGGLEEGRMVMSGEAPSARQSRVIVLHRITWEPLADGRVRQHWEASRDDGETWGTLFEGFYSRRD